MTWLIAIDESGNLGSDSRFFVMSAIIVKRVRVLNPVFKAIPKYREESKFYNSNDDEIISVLSALSSADVSVVAVEVDKYDYRSTFYGKYGNDLYVKVLSELLDKVFRFIGMHDVNLFIDRSTFIGLNELRTISADYSKLYGCHLERCEKVTSHQNKCVQLADYVAGAFYHNLQYDDDTFRSIIEKNILCP